MLQHIKKWLQNHSLIIALAVSFSIIVLSLISTDTIAKTNITVSDKVLHSIAYLVLTWSWLLYFKNKNTASFFLLLMLFLTVFGIILEFLQGSLTTHRTSDWYDVLANISGIVLGFITYRIIKKFLLIRT